MPGNIHLHKYMLFSLFCSIDGGCLHEQGKCSIISASKHCLAIKTLPTALFYKMILIRVKYSLEEGWKQHALS